MGDSAPQIIDSPSFLDEFAAPVQNQVRLEPLAAEATTQNMVAIPTEEIAETSRLASHVQVPQRTAEHQVDVLASSSTSTSSGRIDETVLHSIIEQLFPLKNLAAQMENIEKSLLLTKRMMEPQERVPWKRRRPSVPMPEIMEEGTYVRYGVDCVRDGHRLPRAVYKNQAPLPAPRLFLFALARDDQCARLVRGDPGRVVFVRFEL